LIAEQGNIPTVQGINHTSGNVSAIRYSIEAETIEQLQSLIDGHKVNL
jgi:hypothetical protein